MVLGKKAPAGPKSDGWVLGGASVFSGYFAETVSPMPNLSGTVEPTGETRT